MSSLLQYNERLMKTGLSKEQSSALIEVLSDMHDNNLVSKAEFNEFRIITNNNFENLRKDMQNMENGIRKDMQSMESGIRKDMQAMGDRLTIRLSGVMAVMLGILYTLQKLN